MKKLILILIPLLLVGGFFFLRGGSTTDAMIPMQTLAVEEQNIESKIYLNGSVTTEEVRTIKPSSTSKVEQIHVKVGDLVKKGDHLASMNSDTLETTLKTKKNQHELEVIKLERLKSNSDLSLINSLKSAKIRRDSAEKKMQDEKALLEAGVITKQQYNQTVSSYNEAQIAYENANNSLQRSSREFDIFSQEKTIEALEIEIADLEKKLEDHLIKSPIDGTITEIKGTEGEAVGQYLMVVSNFDKNVIVANVSEADINKVEIGQTVTITANSAKGKTFDGKVSFISPGSKNISGKKQAYVEIKVTLNEQAPELRTNFSVNMKLITAAKENVKSVRFEAVKARSNGEEYVLVQAADGTTKEVTVQTGLTDDVYVEVVSDQLNVGDIIIIDHSNVGAEEELGFF